MQVISLHRYRVCPRAISQGSCCRTLALLALAGMLPACQNIWKASGHPATTPDQIRILVKTPAQYERLGTVTHLYDEGAPWQDGADAAAIIQDLLTESGSMGANALLLVDDTTMADTSISMTYQGKSYRLPVIGKTKTVIGQAIFTIRE
jgi:hypothetical protein